ncbi:MAG: type IX secretion system membrane protein PorP/SprF [Schleiferiaceae bacterium]|nr:type IX secretion system membrane protein PorP/SprF [Schleiferiaceae bacterium]
MKRIATWSLLLVSFYVFGQQDAQFTQFWNQRLFYNPAVAGSENAICFNSGIRTQWTGFEGAPNTVNLTASIPVSILKGGIGVRLERDEVGFFQDNAVGISYAYQHRFVNGASLGVGVGVDLRSKGIGGGSWLPPESANDPSLFQLNNNTDMMTDMSFGVYYRSEKMWLSLSSTRLLQSLGVFNNLQEGTTLFSNSRHFYLMGGYDFPIENTSFVVTPQFLLKTDINSPVAVDINTMVTYNNQIWGGVTYRHQDALAIIAGYNITNDFRLGYSYDITTSAISAYSGGSHEIFARYCFTIEIPPREKGYYRNVRFL